MSIPAAGSSDDPAMGTRQNGAPPAGCGIAVSVGDLWGRFSFHLEVAMEGLPTTAEAVV
ncbi:MAG: hypothetical protein M3083_01655 [Actinomycetota bacterium]|nr:hypothetical protein [Actinomycetota bacterium]